MMTNFRRVKLLADFVLCNQRGRFTDTQMNQLQVVRQSIEDSISDLEELQCNLRKQLHELQASCPHPFRFVQWKERIPAGNVKGECDLCGDVRWFDKYPKRLQKTVEFV